MTTETTAIGGGNGIRHWWKAAAATMAESLPPPLDAPATQNLTAGGGFFFPARPRPSRRVEPTSESLAFPLPAHGADAAAGL
jgi:hypothetical protein